MTQICNLCLTAKPLEDFPKEPRRIDGRKKRCKACVYMPWPEFKEKYPARWRAKLAAQKAYLKRNPLFFKIKSYQHFDRRNGYESMSKQDALALIYSASGCYYCGTDNRDILGLDRRDNQAGHTKNNCVVSCEVCNVTLSDLPKEVKDLLRPGLTEARQLGLLDSYVIPCKRSTSRKKENAKRKIV